MDVAAGMEYLHTNFKLEGKPSPLIHRDLKSGNLLLEAPPPAHGSREAAAEGGGVKVLITDFGISRDKAYDPSVMQTSKVLP